jgi:hypothetical protein
MANSCPAGRWSAGGVPALLLARRVERKARAERASARSAAEREAAGVGARRAEGRK